MNFKDMKSEISHIQEKIDGLEKKLCNLSLYKFSQQFEFSNQFKSEQTSIDQEKF